MSTTLTTDGPTFEEAQGPFAPETLAGPVFSRRFTGIREDGKHAIVTDYFGVVDLREMFPDNDYGDRPYDVLEMVEFAVTDDSMEIDDSDYQEEWPNYRSCLTVEEAAASARKYADTAVADYFHVA